MTARTTTMNSSFSSLLSTRCSIVILIVVLVLPLPLLLHYQVTNSKALQQHHSPVVQSLSNYGSKIEADNGETSQIRKKQHVIEEKGEEEDIKRQEALTKPISTASAPLSWKYVGDTNNTPDDVSSCTQPDYLKGTLDRGIAIQINKQYLSEITANDKKARIVAIGQRLLDAAENHTSTLLSLQIGGMDGKTGDPIFRMVSERSLLPQWLPIVVEPVHRNFVKLQQTYEQHRKKKQVKCPLLLNQAISYVGESNTCSFCYYDKEKSECSDVEDWVKDEVGSMDCKAFERKYPNCYVKQDLSCGSIHDALGRYNLAISQLSILQIDVEGFENTLIPGFLKALTDDELPPVINFESKILAGRRQLKAIVELLEKRGYSVHQKRIDTLALLVQ